ncbi:putative flavonoid 3',5'-hydroxylase [Rosa chinensis]|uniref:Putative flavonoid 3',5'-hydroxylase n=1 Tax=Rosa chinensis TaxID=74649 RepID=A0A2P6P3K8_ROSCH|nr:putative flavonoid 3',5'-hydroxylase [Rosa chinensis]
MAFSEYGPNWRHVRKLYTLHLFCQAKIEAFAPLRKDELEVLLRKLKKAAEEGGVVDVSEDIGVMKEDRFDLKAVIEETFYLAEAFNISDFVPSLAAVDIQGLTKRMKKISKTVDPLLEKIIDQQARTSC